jgi:flagellar basal body-associated protein FliL
VASADQLAKSVSPAQRSPLTTILPVIAVGILGMWLWSNRTNELTARGNEISRIKSTLHLETFVLNLADSDQRSYLRVGIDLGLSKEAKRGEEVPVARIRDTILGVLTLAKGDELLTAKGKDRLKADLQHALQERMPELGVDEVYFTEFLIQR